ncbi:methylated-DNA--[protein]-cysteine S-methyltransferase [Ureibacillus manganicus]|uniref:methylated-DNA--[protein]-cysteine S-methyltransferase n=1 Tax=Ureibacillus manganicus DSM 26584 TaxID=1384049 RepID=A0A0A3I6P5_9BACL|nr:methylated-DNA--[protein]-cysteine S-methyltransferase [Ureibacillus manganicus]KGR78358.1 cysteine methyltransferase [Ureibacillus manganicus DSM 26584]
MGQNETIFYSLFEYNGWSMYIAATEKGLCYTGSQNEPFDEFEKWVNKKWKNRILLKDDERLTPYVKELVQYIDGELKEFTCSFDLRGTTFQIDVWNVLLKIPYAKTICYSDVANMIGNPRAVRAVGTAIGANPIAIIIPCHRVLGKDGSLTGYSGGIPVKEKLLQLEGIQYKQ